MLPFQSEAKCDAMNLKMSFYSHGRKIHFHKKGFERSLVLKVRVFGTWKWLCSRPRFEIEAWGNSEMAYLCQCANTHASESRLICLLNRSV